MKESCKILIVEDEAIIGMALAADLEEAGHQVVGIALTGEEALAIVKGQQIDLIILDIKLGNGIDGLHTLNEIRKNSRPYVFVVSGNSDAATGQRIQAMDIDRFFVKPVNMQSLLEAIQQLKIDR